MINLLGFSFFGLNLVQFIGIIVFVISLTLLLLFVPISRPIIAVVCCAIFFISGIYSCFYSIRYFTLKSSIYGDASEGQHNITKVVYDGFSSFEFQTFGFNAGTNSNEYFCKATFSKTVNLKDKNAFAVNDSVIDTVDKADDYIKATYNYCFFDDNKVSLFDDKLYITLYTYKDSMQLEIKTNGGDKAVKFWRRYLTKNKFVLRLVSSKSENQMPQNDNFNVENEIEGDFKIKLKVQFTDKLIEKTTYEPFVHFSLCEFFSNNVRTYTVYATDKQKDFEFDVLPTVYMLIMTNMTNGVSYVDEEKHTIGIYNITQESPTYSVVITVDYRE